MNAKFTLLWKVTLSSLALAATLLAPALVARAQLAPDRAVVGDRLVLNGSFKAVAADTQSATPRQAALVRSTLTESELDREPLSFEVSLAMRDLPRLHAREAAGETVDHARLEADHLPFQADFDAAARWLASEGFTITRRDGHRLGLFATGTRRQIQDAFRTRFAEVSIDGETSLSIVSAPSVPAGLNAVLGVVGLQPYQRLHSFFHPALPAPGFTPDTDNAPPYTVSEILGAFDGKGNTLTGSGQTIAIVIDAVPVEDDMTKFYSLNSSAQVYSRFSFEYTNSGTRDTPGGEETLDVEWSSTIAPQAHTHLYCTGTLSFVNTEGAYSKIGDDLHNGTQPDLHQLSLSYGADEDAISSSTITTEEQYFATIASYGVTILVSSGDNGAFDGNGGLSVSYPASDPSVTAVGGTSIVLNTSTGAVDTITGWTADADGFSDGRIASSGGGYSGAFPKPSWQKGTGVPSADKRCVPDIAASSDQDEPGLLVLTYKGMQYVGGYANGTSWAAPTWAGLIARLNQGRAAAGTAPLGLLNPKIYPLLGTNNFRDITVGRNGHHGETDGYSCTTGYDLVTGIGTPNFSNLAAKLAPSSGSAPSITSTGTLVAHVGQSFTYQIKATNDPTSYGVGGLFAGVTVNQQTGLITGKPTATGTHTLTLRATNGAGTGTKTLTVTVKETAPVITSSKTATAYVGKAFKYQIEATNTATSYGVSGLFAGVTVNKDTGLISGTPTGPGTHTLTLHATNSGGTGDLTLTLTVYGIPAVTSGATLTVHAGKAFSYQITATEKPTSYGAGGLFSGVSIDQKTGLISGTAASTGTHSLDLRAINGAGTGHKTLTLKVEP